MKKTVKRKVFLKKSFMGFFIIMAAMLVSSTCHAVEENAQAGSLFSKEEVVSEEKEFLDKAAICLKQKKYLLAEKWLKNAWEINPQNNEARFLWARLYRAQGNKEKAEKTIQTAIAAHPENDDLYVRAGFFFQEQGDLKRAQSFFGKALMINSGNKEAGEALNKIWEGAYKKSLIANPKDQTASLKLGLIYIKQGKLNDAERMFSHAMRLNPQSDEALAAMGWLEVRRKDPKRAKEFFSKALSVNPRNELARKGMAQLSEAEKKMLV